ncbi:MAG TPA: hypothetical protein VK590_15420 [Saprospiraceae bacterium]|nr:hypothetical protein [Saprospiraceae bacterium]
MKSICLLLLASLFCFPDYYALLIPKDKAIGKEPQQDFMSYYHYVNLSNRSIYAGDLANAALFLDSAFNCVKTPWFVDLKRQVILNWKLKRKEKNIELLKLFVRNKQIDSTQLSNIFPKELLSEYKIKFKSNNLTKQMESYKNQLELLFKTDQDIRANYNMYCFKDKPDKQNPNTNGNAINYKIQDSLNVLNAYKFIKLIRQYGFPTEDKLGYFINNKVKGAEKKTIELSNVVDIFFRLCNNSIYREDINTILDIAFNNNQIQPVFYAYLKDQNYLSSNRKRFKVGLLFIEPSVVIINKEYYRQFLDYSKSLLDSINTNRISIGLDSLHIEQHQIVSSSICQDSTITRIISITNNSFLDHIPEGITRWAIEKEGKTMGEYKININKIKKECHCKERMY